MAKLLPPGVVLVEAGDLADEDRGPAPEEVPLMAGASERRRREFQLGRACARRALRRLGLNDVAVLMGPQREPLWPTGVVGSLTHCGEYCAAAVARAGEVSSLGIDAELVTRLPPSVMQVVCSEDERRQADALPGDHWPTVIFSAKEAIYKAWYPVTHLWLDYHDVELTLDAGRGRFQAAILAGPPQSDFPWNPVHGRFALSGSIALTAVALPPAR